MNPIVEFMILLALLQYLNITGFWWWIAIIVFCTSWLFLSFVLGVLTALSKDLKKIALSQTKEKEEAK